MNLCVARNTYLKSVRAFVFILAILPSRLGTLSIIRCCFGLLMVEIYSKESLLKYYFSNIGGINSYSQFLTKYPLGSVHIGSRGCTWITAAACDFIMVLFYFTRVWQQPYLVESVDVVDAGTCHSSREFHPLDGRTMKGFPKHFVLRCRKYVYHEQGASAYVYCSPL